MSAPVVVTAAVVQRADRFLLTRRPDGSHLGGRWEFPGGKCEAGESLSDSLRREMREELGVDVDISAEIFVIEHTYPERMVRLHFFACDVRGEPHPVLGQEMRWVRREDLSSLDFPEADRELIDMLVQVGRD